MVRPGEPTLLLATVEDITRLRYLETVRRDFVANVSHELRTPSPPSTSWWKPCSGEP
jgi:signal transduction histidine kinase